MSIPEVEAPWYLKPAGFGGGGDIHQPEYQPGPKNPWDKKSQLFLWRAWRNMHGRGVHSAQERMQAALVSGHNPYPARTFGHNIYRIAADAYDKHPDTNYTSRYNTNDKGVIEAQSQYEQYQKYWLQVQRTQTRGQRRSIRNQVRRSGSRRPGKIRTQLSKPPRPWKTLSMKERDAWIASYRNNTIHQRMWEGYHQAANVHSRYIPPPPPPKSIWKKVAIGVGVALIIVLMVAAVVLTDGGAAAFIPETAELLGEAGLELTEATLAEAEGFGEVAFETGETFETTYGGQVTYRGPSIQSIYY